MANNILTQFDAILEDYRGLKIYNIDRMLIINKVLGTKYTLVDLFSRSSLANSNQLASIREVIEKLHSGYPLQYILNNVKFAELELYVDENVLIPRPETEELVYEAYELIKKTFGTKEITIADVGTGSGAIAIGLTHLLTRYNLSKSKTYAIDNQEKALEVARKNIEKFKFTSIELIHGHLIDHLIENKIIVDALVANLPYVKDDYPLDKTVQYEPATALYGGEVGTELIEELLKNVVQITHPNSIICMEIGYDQKDAIWQIASKYFPNSNIIIDKDMQGNYRQLKILPFKKKN